MLRFFLIFIALLGCTQNKEAQPEKWQKWVAEKKQDFEKEFATPTIVQHLYLKNTEKAYVAREDRGVRLAESCKENCLFSLSLKEGKVFLKNLKEKGEVQLLEAKKETELKKPHFISYISYDEGKTVRLFLFNLKQENLKKKRQRFFFDYSEAYRVEGALQWLKAPEEVQFSRSDGSRKKYHLLAKINYKLKGQPGTLSVYNFDISKAADKEQSEVMVMFRDLSNNKKTYGAGRFLNVHFAKKMGEMKDGDPVAIDFNYSFNPPCATSTGFHCPVPQDKVALEVLAGESYYKFQ